MTWFDDIERNTTSNVEFWFFFIHLFTFFNIQIIFKKWVCWNLWKFCLLKAFPIFFCLILFSNLFFSWLKNFLWNWKTKLHIVKHSLKMFFYSYYLCCFKCFCTIFKPWFPRASCFANGFMHSTNVHSRVLESG